MGQRRESPLDGDEVVGHLDSLDGPLVGVGPRAIWLRLLPMRAICVVRSRSTSTAGAVQVRVRAMARRISAESGTPAAFALARVSASSAADTRTVAVRRSVIGPVDTGEGGEARARALQRRADLGGIEGGQGLPLASPGVRHRVCWLMTPNGSGASTLNGSVRPLRLDSLRPSSPPSPLLYIT